MYDFYEEIYEPSDYDILISETVNTITKGIKTEAAKYYIKIQDENNKLKEENDKLLIQVKNIENRENQLEIDKKNMERDVKRMKIAELMSDFKQNVYRADYELKYKTKKCDKCDENGKIKYKTPSGREEKETCKCRYRIKVYEPKIEVVSEFRMNKDKDKLIVWYKPYEDEEGYTTSNVVEKLHDDVEEFTEDMDYYNMYFATEEACQKYCDYLNNTENN